MHRHAHMRTHAHTRTHTHTHAAMRVATSRDEILPPNQRRKTPPYFERTFGLGEFRNAHDMPHAQTQLPTTVCRPRKHGWWHPKCAAITCTYEVHLNVRDAHTCLDPMYKCLFITARITNLSGCATYERTRLCACACACVCVCVCACMYV